MQAHADGLSLVAYTGADAGQMTVGSELNKLAGNIALFRNAAGVHWRSDYTESLLLGEAIAIRLLQEMSLGFNEDDAYFQLTRFDGDTIRISEGKVVRVVGVTKGGTRRGDDPRAGVFALPHFCSSVSGFEAAHHAKGVASDHQLLVGGDHPQRGREPSALTAPRRRRSEARFAPRRGHAQALHPRRSSPESRPRSRRSRP